MFKDNQNKMYVYNFEVYKDNDNFNNIIYKYFIIIFIIILFFIFMNLVILQF